MKVYRLYHANRIEEEEITRKTESSIFYINYAGKEERSAIKNIYYEWFDTPKEAFDNAILKAESEIRSAEISLDKRKKKLELLKQLEKQP